MNDINFHQFNMLVGMLKKHNIPFELVLDDSDHKILHYPTDKNVRLSVTIGIGIYGSLEGQLETWTGDDKDDPIGWRSAQAVFDEIALDWHDQKQSERRMGIELDNG